MIWFGVEQLYTTRYVCTIITKYSAFKASILNLKDMNKIKWYNLTRWDKVKHYDEVVTFHRIDWNQWQFRDAEWMTRIGNYQEYILGDDGIYIPYVTEVCQQKHS